MSAADLLDVYVEAHVRGVVEVGRSIAEHGCLDAEVVGRAIREGRHDPQDLKKVWHHVARFGSPWRT